VRRGGRGLLLALNDGTRFGGCLSLSGSTGHALLKHADRFGAIEQPYSTGGSFLIGSALLQSRILT
jgi:hypothetical protein